VLKLRARVADQRQVRGEKVTCKHCQGGFRFGVDNPGQFESLSVYVYCPQCNERLRLSPKYLGTKVACKACKEQLVVKKPKLVAKPAQ